MPDAIARVISIGTKRQYDTQRLQKFVSSTCLPPGCKATMQPGTGILEILCESQQLVDYLAAHPRILPAPADDGTNRHQNPCMAAIWSLLPLKNC
ncbi:MAG TPA: hypothetical protein DCZ55_00605 [Cyanobacteria bacterium UBA11371]|nr:hypothetical protein [Cyanobacteria bacterium UBA11371]HBE37050.1 hypothetical protein [Cyanobacteria bacterium UBA11368]